MQSTSTPAPTTSNAALHSLTFEQALTQLQDIVARLEEGALSLDDTVSTFRHGSELAAHCQRLIADAELKITRLAEDPEAQGSDNVSTSSQHPGQ